MDSITSSLTDTPARPQPRAGSRSYPTPAAAHSSPAACAPPHCSDTTAESQATPPPESAAPPRNPSAVPPGPSPPRPPSATRPPAHCCTAPGFHPWVESFPTHTHTERYPDLHCCQSTAARTSGTRPSSHPHRTSQTPPTVSEDRSPPPLAAVASPAPSAESSHPYLSSK